MNFKNKLEEHCYEIAKATFGTSVNVTHNQTIKIESALSPEVAAFKGPPAKEVDVLAADLLETPKIKLLVSCKDFVKRAEPAHVQEWAAVIRTMNAYSEGTRFFGLIICPTGFTSGCEAWATSHNLGLIPPLKGRRLVFAPDTVFQMFKRALVGVRARMKLSETDLEAPPAFFDLVYSLVEDFEGHEEAAQEGRYFLAPSGWVASFNEVYSSVAGLSVEGLAVGDDGAAILSLSGGRLFRFTGPRIEFGEFAPPKESTTPPRCSKNIEDETCTLEFIRSKVVGLPITSAGDFGDYIEFGIDGRFNLGLHSDSNGFHLVSTENPVEEHRL